MVFQSAHSEGVRVAHDIATQLQREENFKKILADRMAEDSNTVRNIERSEATRAEERHERQRRRKSGNQSDDDVDAEDSNQENEALFADGGFDFMA